MQEKNRKTQSKPAKRPFAFSLQEQKSGQWRLSWVPQARAVSIAVHLHRGGAWGGPGTDTSLTAPILGLEQRPASHQYQISWPEKMIVRAEKVSDFHILPSSTKQQSEITQNLILRANGSQPKIEMIIHGRESDVKATVVTALSIDEEYSSIRTLIEYDVRFAPLDTFRFSVPPGIGQDLRIEGNGIRERILNSDAGSDEWTIVTQDQVSGDFRLNLTWKWENSDLKSKIQAPQVQALDVTSQRGYVLLEGSETLRLNTQTENLSEADASELPDLPWEGDSRILAVYRYVTLPYTLSVQAEKFQTEPALKALVTNAELVTAIAQSGDRFTLARYTVVPTSARQFFEIQLPTGAELWSTLLNGEGVKPSRRKTDGQAEMLLVPLPSLISSGKEYVVQFLYREKSEQLAELNQLDFAGPNLPIPLNQTSWDIYLPKEFEYLSYGGSMLDTSSGFEPLARYFRAAHYPNRILFMNIGLFGILMLTLMMLVALKIAANPKRAFQLANTPFGKKITQPPPLPGGAEPTIDKKQSGCMSSLVSLLIVGAIIMILAAIAVPPALSPPLPFQIPRRATRCSES